MYLAGSTYIMISDIFADLIYISSIIYSLIPLVFGIFLLDILKTMVVRGTIRKKSLWALAGMLSDKSWLFITSFTIGLYGLTVPSMLISLFTNLNVNYYFYFYAAVTCTLGILDFVLKKNSIKNFLKKFVGKFLTLGCCLSLEFLILFVALTALLLRFLQLSLIYLTSPLIWQWDATAVYLPIAKSIFLSGSLERNTLFYSGGTAINGNPPLMPLFYAFTMSFNFYAFRFVPFPLYVLILLLIYKLARMLSNNKFSGLIAVTVFMFSPIMDFIWARDLLYLDLAFVLFLLISTYYLFLLLEKFANSEFINFILFCISIGLLIMSKDIAISFSLIGFGFYIWIKTRHRFLGSITLLLSVLSMPTLLTILDAKFDHRTGLLIPLIVFGIVALFVIRGKDHHGDRISSSELKKFFIGSVFVTLSTTYLLYNILCRNLFRLFPSTTTLGTSEWISIIGPFLNSEEKLIKTLYSRALDPFVHRFIFPFFLLMIVSAILYILDKNSRIRSIYILSLFTLTYWLIGYIFFFIVWREDTRRLFYMLPLLAILASRVINPNEKKVYRPEFPVIFFLIYPIAYNYYITHFIAQSIIGLDVFWQLFTDNPFLSQKEFYFFITLQVLLSSTALLMNYISRRRTRIKLQVAIIGKKKFVGRRNLNLLLLAAIIFLIILTLIMPLFTLNKTIQTIHSKGLVPFYLNNFPQYALRHSGEMTPYVEVLNYINSSGIIKREDAILTFGFFSLAFFTNLKVYPVGPTGAWSEGLMSLRDLINETREYKIINAIEKYNFTFFLIPTSSNPWEYNFYDTVKKHIPMFDYIEKEKCIYAVNQTTGYGLKFTLIKNFKWYKLYKVLSPSEYEEYLQTLNYYFNYERNPIIISDDNQSILYQSTIWNISTIDSSDIKIKGENALKIGISPFFTPQQHQYIRYAFKYPTDFSNYDFISFYWYGNDSGIRITLRFESGSWKDQYEFSFIDSWKGWARLIIPLKLFKVHIGSPSWAYISSINFVFYEEVKTEVTFYLDRITADKGVTDFYFIPFPK